MRWIVAGLTFVNVAASGGLLLGLAGGGINNIAAAISLLIAAGAAAVAFVHTPRDQPNEFAPARQVSEPWLRYRWVPVAGLAFFFALFAFRSFCWLVYPDGGELRIQSPNNLGDLGLHLTLIRNFANGVPLWPEHPLFVFSHLRYPAGVDLFNALFPRAGVGWQQGLVWVGLLATAATFFTFYRWAGLFGAAAFLFNGGMAGYRVVRTLEFLDYQGDKTIAWKSIALSMFVTQRGLLYAIPAGILLLHIWRERFNDPDARPLIPRWVEITLYATMPLFHAHTFVALSLVLLLLFAFGRPSFRGSAIITVVLSVIPATLILWMITDHFAAGSVLRWHPHWVQDDDDFALPFFRFWLLNFGLWPILSLVLVGVIGWRVWKKRDDRWPDYLPFVAAALLLFAVCYFLKLAPWGWDNMKILIWAYFIILPFLWKLVIVPLPAATRAALYVSLFLSGFVSIIGGLAAGRPGFEFAKRGELDAVGSVVHRLDRNQRFAAFPTYNHPLLLQGQKLVVGYPGHLWTEGLDYEPVLADLNALMDGREDWKDLARRLRVRYLFWGPQEQANWPNSSKPWASLPLAAGGEWGQIYDLASVTPQP